MADDDHNHPHHQQQQQTRVLLLNGQTILLQGDAPEHAIGEINADLLQQALQDAAQEGAGLEDEEDEDEDEEEDEEPCRPAAPEPRAADEPQGSPPVGGGGSSNVVAIFQGDQGETHSIQLTVEQAEALGLHFMSEEDGEKEAPVFDDPEPLFDPPPPPAPAPAPAAPALQQQSLGGLSDLGSYINDSSNITLISQLVNGQMTYTVKLNEDQQPGNAGQSFPVSDSTSERPKPKLPLLGPAMSVPSLPANASASVPSVSSVRINSAGSVMAPNTTYVPQKSLLASLNNASSAEKTPKYVMVPSSNSTTAASPSISLLSSSSSLKSSSMMQAIARPVITHPPPLQTSSASIIATTVSSSLLPSRTTPLTGIPLVNSNINITRTPSAGSSLLQSSSSSLNNSGGMIRVVAGGATTRMVQQMSSLNGPKYTNILTPSGRIVSASTTPQTVQKTFTVNSSAGLVAKTNSVSSTVTPSVMSEAQHSSTHNAMQSTAVRLNINSSKPLGSSENPIQLIQHGQTFHSVQALSQEQLRQIATVLQQQHLDSAPRTKNVLFDAETNTRIIYRVVYPEDLDLHEHSSLSERQAAGESALSSSSSRGRGRRGRPPKSALHPFRRIHDHSSPAIPVRKPTPQTVDLDLDEDRLLDDATKVERKKQIARTRSGRLSRPPRHMVKDYKRLHHLDFADADLDDSDGGYSDYQIDREVEDGGSPKSTTMPSTGTLQELASPSHLEPPSTSTGQQGNAALLPGLQAVKRKISSHFRCPTCQKVYLGHSRMARHFDMFPDHGSIDQLKSSSSTAPSSPVPLPDSTQGKVTVGPLNGIVRPTGGRRRGKRRGPWAYTTPEAKSERRKLKLREAMGLCEASELLEVAGPSLASSASLWELLLLRVENVRSEESLMATLCEELRALLEKVQSVAADVLHPVAEGASGDNINEGERQDSKPLKEEVFVLQDEVLCSALGLPIGKYRIINDYLLRGRAHKLDGSLEPPLKRSKFKEDAEKPEDKPSCPEVLSALALESRPSANSTTPSEKTSVAAKVPHSQPSSSEKSPEGSELMETSESCPSPSKNVNRKAESKSVSDQLDDNPFLLPTTTDICVDELSHVGKHHGTETVDDIVNERLKNLTGFTVGAAESVSIPEPSQQLSQFQDPQNSSDVGVPTFDPEMALAAMGEGEQPDAESTLSQFTLEIALAAMGEGDSESQRNNHQHQPFTATVQPVYNPLSSGGKNAAVAIQERKESEQRKLPNYPNSASEVFSNLGLGNEDPPPEENSSATKEEIAAFTTCILTNNTQNNLITSLADSASSIAKCDGVTDPSEANFDPEIALAAMGEGDPTDVKSTIHSGRRFNPKMALVSMGEGVTSEASNSGGEPAFQLAGMDVSLDESGPELDFDALSAEFTRTAPHS